MNRAVCQTMTEWESKDDEINEDTDLEEELENRSAELYDILCEHCDGEALMIRQAGGGDVWNPSLAETPPQV